jgi:hypothetical protein
MKKIINQITLFIILMLFTTQLFAQEKKVDVDISLNKDGDNSIWYMQPWVWIVGGAVFILLLVAMFRGSGKKE